MLDSLMRNLLLVSQLVSAVSTSTGPVRKSLDFKNDGKPFTYKGRQCRQNKDVCADGDSNCCTSVPHTATCNQGKELFWEGVACDDNDADGVNGGTYSYAEKGGSYFCCDPIDKCIAVEGKCMDNGSDCCAPPAFEAGADPSEYLDAKCAAGYTLQWFYGSGGHCGIFLSGKFGCCDSTSTTKAPTTTTTKATTTAKSR